MVPALRVVRDRAGIVLDVGDQPRRWLCREKLSRRHACMIGKSADRTATQQHFWSRERRPRHGRARARGPHPDRRARGRRAGRGSRVRARHGPPLVGGRGWWRVRVGRLRRARDLHTAALAEVQGIIQAENERLDAQDAEVEPVRPDRGVESDAEQLAVQADWMQADLPYGGGDFDEVDIYGGNYSEC